ncbi:MAG: hypothetical protein AAF270_03505 [Pseudomonadota bacterium]
MRTTLLALILIGSAGTSFAQGQDSTRAARDLAVIATLLGGDYDNMNQYYFERRGGAADLHRRLHLTASAKDNPAGTFRLTGFFDADRNQAMPEQRWQLREHSDGLRVIVDIEDEEGQTCRLTVRREAAQFVGATEQPCAPGLPQSVVISERQLWYDDGRPNGDYRLHRTRAFDCYADIPGVGGGRDEPYERYDGLQVHDQGGVAWFTDSNGRELSISLLLVDWPINNYDGVFTRDSLVIYVGEKTADGSREIGYAFTEPDAERIGINLKWMLASCYMLSNAEQTPFM